MGYSELKEEDLCIHCGFGARKCLMYAVDDWAS
ncbi:hypothetical protein PRO82_001542 [Candidatus Protochlamydia amoebophila]|nr:hypothetical protein [Candidatus Protochlamydia amoebophila]